MADRLTTRIQPVITDMEKDNAAFSILISVITIAYYLVVAACIGWCKLFRDYGVGAFLYDSFLFLGSKVILLVTSAAYYIYDIGGLTRRLVSASISKISGGHDG